MSLAFKLAVTALLMELSYVDDAFDCFVNFISSTSSHLFGCGVGFDVATAARDKVVDLIFNEVEEVVFDDTLLPTLHNDASYLAERHEAESYFVNRSALVSLLNEY